jgi:biotin synthase
MIGLGPWIPHPDTPAVDFDDRETAPERLALNDAATTLKALALTRLLCPRANLPSTTALATVDPVSGREDGLRWGANVVMPNLTPSAFRAQYEIYPGKVSLADTPESSHGDLLARLASLGRTLGGGRGDSAALTRRQGAGA